MSEKNKYDEYVKIIRHALETGDYRIVNCGLHTNNEPKRKDDRK